MQELEQLNAKFRDKVVDLMTEREGLMDRIAGSSEGEMRAKINSLLDS